MRPRAGGERERPELFRLGSWRSRSPLHPFYFMRKPRSFNSGFPKLESALGSPHAPHHAQKRRAMGNPAPSPSTSLRARLLRSLGKSRMTAQRNNEGIVEALAAMVNPIKIVILIPKESTIAWDAR